jgi:fructose-bisphosphate aldolase class II
MVTLHEVLKQAETEGVAVGHFNVSDLVTLKAVFESASDQNVPVIVGVSEGERQFLGVRRQSINDQREAPSHVVARPAVEPHPAAVLA